MNYKTFIFRFSLRFAKHQKPNITKKLRVAKAAYVVGPPLDGMTGNEAVVKFDIVCNISTQIPLLVYL